MRPADLQRLEKDKLLIREYQDILEPARIHKNHKRSNAPLWGGVIDNIIDINPCKKLIMDNELYSY